MCLKRDFYESLVQKMAAQVLEMVPRALEMIPQTPVGTKFVQDQFFVKVRAMDSRRLF